VLTSCRIIPGGSLPDSGVSWPRALDCVVSGPRNSPCGTGRRPAGLVDAPPVPSGDPVAAMLAHMAHLEAASVDAFVMLASELRAHGAPASLIRRAERAARDEVRHARMVGALARRRGASPSAAVVERVPERDLEALAIENAREGCVGETYGACVAWFQAGAAGDRDIARVMAKVAVDETRHGELAFAVDAWARPLLSDGARRRVDEARAEALADLSRQASRPVPPVLVRAAGLPSAPRATRMVAQMARDLSA
jgi:hypothetical protein